jgi:hypothetical protein
MWVVLHCDLNWLCSLVMLKVFWIVFVESCIGMLLLCFNVVYSIQYILNDRLLGNAYMAYRLLSHDIYHTGFSNRELYELVGF